MRCRETARSLGMDASCRTPGRFHLAVDADPTHLPGRRLDLLANQRVACLGSAGIMAVIDPRWSTLRLMFRVELVMITLILISAVRARTELDPGKPVSWLLLAAFVGVFVGSVYLCWTMARRLRNSRRSEQEGAT
jgi:hypothetical protein